ncbi:MAG TPA: bifunctional nicotinamidase/pyrazinamidase [Candidatus Obscuribacterales bacterium]
MKLIKVGAGVLNQTPFDWDNNKRNIVDAISEARRRRISLLCLPELCITGYGCEDDFFRADLRYRAWDVLNEILPATRGMVVSVGLPVLHNNALFNCGALLVDGEIAGLVAKRNLAGDGIHYEPRWFEAWNEAAIAHVKFGDRLLPMGDIHFRIGGIKIGYEICEDAWVYNRPGNKLAPNAVDIILNPSASHFAMGKLQTRKQLVAEGSRAFGASYVYSNLLGNEAGRAIYDGGAIIASGGKILTIGKRFSFHDVDITSAVIDVESTRMMQLRTYSFTPNLLDDPSCVDVDFEFPECELEPPSPLNQDEWESGPHIRENEFARAVALGLFDYLRKSGSHGYIVSLSGGADSSAVSCLVYLMIELALQDLRIDGVKRKLSYLEKIDDCKTSRDLIGKLLTVVYQATRNSSHETRNSARVLSEALGARYYEFEVDKIVDAYTNMVSSAVKRKLTFETDDLALQNIQARVRNPGVWMLANIYDAILLCTSNRSEGAVGYCTMDGDTSGGLAPLAGVDKAFIRHWLKWLRSHGPLETGPLPELDVVIKQDPRPELRPEAMQQTAEKDLMPYAVLDLIEECSIENNQSPLECYQVLRARFPEKDKKTLAEWVEKFFVLWSRNQWKRERLPAALHVASRNLDPRTWRRAPILSGAFKKELREMWACVRKDYAKSESRQDKQARMKAATLPKDDNGAEGGDHFRARNGSAKQTAAGQKKLASRTKSALIVVDAQKGFGTNGELPVPGAESIVPVVNALAEKFDLVLATQDWHPADHVSFAINHQHKKIGDTLRMKGYLQPLFPMHCVQNTKSANFFDGLNTKAFKKVFRKGMDADVDSFSAFIDNAGNNATELETYLKKHGVRHIFLTGVCTNFCVKATALDGIKLGFDVTVIEDACKGVDAGNNTVKSAIKLMRENGVEIISSEAILQTSVKKERSAGRSRK